MNKQQLLDVSYLSLEISVSTFKIANFLSLTWTVMMMLVVVVNIWLCYKMENQRLVHNIAGW